MLLRESSSADFILASPSQASRIEDSGWDNSNGALPTPKLSAREKRASAFPYYAGYSERFVAAAIEQLSLAPNDRILDPWNGSGTTSYIASQLGLQVTGVDLNPVLTIVARARGASHISVERAITRWKSVEGKTSTQAGPTLEKCAEIYNVYNTHYRQEKGRIEESEIRSLIISSIFSNVRDSFSDARTSNPSWFSSKICVVSMQSTSEVYAKVLAHLERLRMQVTNRPCTSKFKSRLLTGDLRNIRLSAGFDGVITSPPYLTRIDYVKATWPELRFLETIGYAKASELRGHMIGTPLVGSYAPETSSAWGSTCMDILSRVEIHPSKASSTYYHRFYRKYFADMQKSLRKIFHLTRGGGKICLVVQTSHYKELFIDLPKIIIEMGEPLGLFFEGRQDFLQSRSIASINARAAHAAKLPVESALFFRKHNG